MTFRFALALATALVLTLAGPAAAQKFEETRHPLAAGNGQLTPTATPIGVVAPLARTATSTAGPMQLLALDGLNRTGKALTAPLFAPTNAFTSGASPQRMAQGDFNSSFGRGSVTAVANQGDNSVTVYDTSSGQSTTISGLGLRGPVRIAIGFQRIFVLNSPDAGGWEIVSLRPTGFSSTGAYTSFVVPLDPVKYDNDPTQPYEIAATPGTSQGPGLVIADGPGIQYFTPNGSTGNLSAGAPLTDPAAAATDVPVAITGRSQSNDAYVVTKGPGNPGKLVVWESEGPFAHPAPGGTSVTIADINARLQADAVVGSTLTTGTTVSDSVRIFPRFGAAGDDYATPPVVVPIAANPYTPDGTASEPVSVTTGDFDNDGRQEIATANRAAGDVSVLHQIGAATQATLTVSPAQLTANGTSTATATATFKDAAGRGVFGDQVSITAAGPGDPTAGPTVSAVRDVGDGTYTATITSSRQTGQVTVTASDTSVSPALTRTATIDQLAGAPATVTLTLSPDTVTADGTTASLASAVVADAQGNAVTGEQVTFDSTGTQAIGSTVDNGNGTYTATITSSTQAGASTITAFVRNLSADATLTQTSQATPNPTPGPAPITPDPPTAEISEPTGQLVLAPGSTGPVTRFSCTEGANGPGLTRCADSNGELAPTGRLDTSQTGRRTYRVTATSASGQTGSARLQYLVAAPPIATIRTPIDGARVVFGRRVATDFSCAEGVGGTGIESCREAGNAPGAPGFLDTSTPGPHDYTVRATSTDGLTAEATVRYIVEYAPLSVGVGAGFGTAITKEPAPFTAYVRGGVPPFTYEWSGPDPDVNGLFPSSLTSTLSFAFRAPGERTVRVRVTDSAVPPQVAVDERTVTVEDRCVRRVDLGVVVATAACFKPAAASTDANPVFRSTSGIKLNGTRISGDLIDVRPGDVTAPSQITSPSATISVRGTMVQAGPLNWGVPFSPAPTGTAREVKITGVGIPPAATRLLGLDLDAGGQWYAGQDADGTGYTRYVANLIIPGFSNSDGAGQSKKNLAVTAQVSVRMDAGGSSVKNAFAQVQNARLGKEIEVENLCLSFISAGTPEDDAQTPGGAKRCEVFKTPSADDVLTCNSDVRADRWDGTAEMKLPFKAIKAIKASGGVSDGKFSYFAAALDLGHAVPLVDPVAWLTQVRAGFCLQPPPLTVTGGASIGVLPDPKDPTGNELIKVNGDFTYVDRYTADDGRVIPWQASLKGSVKAYGQSVGDGDLSFGGNNIASLNVRSNQSYADGLVKVEGDVSGQMSFTTGSFNVEGRLHACVAGVICSDAEALVSSTGISACVTIIPSVSFGLLGSTPAIRGGFGFTWASRRLSLMAPSCDIGDWRTTVSRSALRALRQADPTAPMPFVVVDGEVLKNLRLVGGPDGAPDVIVRGPNGETLRLAPGERGTGDFGRHLMVRDTTNNETVVQLVRPAPGTWTIEPQPGPRVTRIDSAPVVPRPVLTGKLTALPDGRQRLDYTYTPQEGVSFVLDEVGADRKSHQRLGESGGDCKLKACAGSLTFTPALGLRGQRLIVATVTRRGNFVDSPTLASYVAPGTRAGRVSAPTLTRTRTGVRVCWRPAPGAVSYNVAARERIKRNGRLAAFGYGVAEVTTRPCAAFPAPTPGSALRVTIAAKDAIGGRSTPVSALLHLPERARPARVRGVQVTRLSRNRLLVTWAPGLRTTEKFAVVVNRGGRRRQALPTHGCGGTVLPASRGAYVTIRLAGLNRDGVAGPITLRRLTVARLAPNTNGRRALLAGRGHCRLR